MTINYRYMHYDEPEMLGKRELDEHYTWLSSFDDYDEPGRIFEQPGPEGFENYHVVDVLGKEFQWMNATFTEDKFTWYIWYESVFLVPDEMIPFLRLRWT